MVRYRSARVSKIGFIEAIARRVDWFDPVQRREYLLRAGAPMSSSIRRLSPVPIRRHPRGSALWLS